MVRLKDCRQKFYESTKTDIEKELTNFINESLLVYKAKYAKIVVLPSFYDQCSVYTNLIATCIA